MAKNSSKPSQFDFLPRFPGDRPTVPAALELNSATAWAEFERLRDGDPPASPGPSPRGGGTAFAPTEPDNGRFLRPEPPIAPRAAPRPALTLHDVMVEARRFNRVCPKPDQWQRLYEMLPVAASTNARLPPAPLSGPAWRETSAMPKRMCLRAQIEWAEEHGALEPVLEFLKALPEEQWHHMDD